MRDDKLKIKKDEVNATVHPIEQSDSVKPVIQITEKPSEHEKRANTHMYERPISESVGGGFGFSKEEINEMNDHLGWLRSKYYEELER